MTPEQMAAMLTALGVSLDEIVGGTDPRDWDRDQLDGAVTVWALLDTLITNLEIVRRDHGVVLARRLDDEYRSTSGVTVHRVTPRTEAWDGHTVLGELAIPLVDTTDGEIVDAIPLDVARAVLPACGQGATSSKWKVSELRRVIPDAERRLRSVSYGDSVIARGPLPYQARRTKRPPADTATNE